MSANLHDLPGRFFGQEVRRMRLSAGWSQSELADRTGFSDALVGYIENNHRLPSERFAGACDAALNSDGHFARLAVLAREFGTPAAPPSDLLADADEIRASDPLFVPDLAQTDDYTRTLLKAAHVPTADIERFPDARPRLVDLLDASPRLRAWLVIDQTTLYRQIGDPELRRSQFKELLALTDTGRVIIQILPAASGAGALLRIPVTLLSFAEGAQVAHLPETSRVETIARYSNATDHATRFDLARATAWPPARSRGEIATATR